MKKVLINSNDVLFQAGEITVGYKSKIDAKNRVKISSAEDIRDFAKTLYVDGIIELREEIYMACLNRANEVIGWYRLGVGSDGGVVCDMKQIFRIAVGLTNTNAIILVHNHPSGNMKPSDADKSLTRKVKQAGDLMDIKLFDHVIVGAGDAYYSFANEGLIF